MSLAEHMREHNNYKKMFNFGKYIPGECFPEVDIRYAEFIDWLQTQSNDMQNVVTLAMHLSTAFHTKYSPYPHPPVDYETLEKVEKAQKYLAVDFLYELEKD